MSVKTISRSKWFFDLARNHAADAPAALVDRAIHDAKVPADLHACYKALEGKGFTDEERAALRGKIDRRFRELGD